MPRRSGTTCGVNVKRRAQPDAREFLDDLELVAVTAQAVGANVALDFGEQAFRRGRAPGARDAALRVDDELQDVAGERRERQ